ncbi:MAG: DUF6067 family protein [Myxococcota bacterium]|nr:DUF6067 family protein [Myxococcota bacterium]
MNIRLISIVFLFCSCAERVAGGVVGSEEEKHGGLIADPSFEETKPRDRFGRVFPKWKGWRYEGEAEFHVGQIAHSGKSSCLIVGGAEPKIRMYIKDIELDPGRYRITAYIRGLGIGVGKWDMTTEFAFNEKFMRLNKNGTFGWTKLTYVTQIEKRKKVFGPSFGLMAPGLFWVDDVHMERVGQDVPLTPTPVLSDPEETIAPPAGGFSDGFIRCDRCNHKNPKQRTHCYACGENLSAPVASSKDPLKVLEGFEASNPFSGGDVVAHYASNGKKSLCLKGGAARWDGLQDWSGYDFFQIDVFSSASQPMMLTIEIRDKETTGYWTRVNHVTSIPPGRSEIRLGLDQLFVGEKSRPGRNLLLSAITRLVFVIEEGAEGALYFDNLRLTTDTKTKKVIFDTLYAFDFGTQTSPLMPGFLRVDPSTLYSKGIGYGLNNAKLWRSFDVLQPEPLYRDFMCIERGGFAVDLPNGKYHAFLNIDNPSGYWGEYQRFTGRAIFAEGKEVLREKMNYPEFKKKYFRHWETEDRPGENTFEKYQLGYYSEKEFDVEVTDGQLNIEFEGLNWANSVSALIIYPKAEAARGQRFLDRVLELRRAYFEDYFKRVLPASTGDPLTPSPTHKRMGYMWFGRDYMADVYPWDRPFQREIGRVPEALAFDGEYEPITFSIYPIQDLGETAVSVSDLKGPGVIRASEIAVGYVSNRISRMTMEGSVYTIKPRLVIPRSRVQIRKGEARRFWLTVRVPPGTAAGMYRGVVTVAPASAPESAIPISIRVHSGGLDEVDIPIGPWGHEIDIPWIDGSRERDEWRHKMALLSLRRLRDYGFTTFSGLPVLTFKGFENGMPRIDFSLGDKQMKRAKAAGFRMPVVSYCPLRGFTLYKKDTRRAEAAGFEDYSKFLKKLFGHIQKHARQNDWLPVYWNIGDEPLGAGLKTAIENARAYKKAFPKGPPFFTAATSYHTGMHNEKEHLDFATALHVANLALHDKASVERLQKKGGAWALYNGGNRFTLGRYAYKAAKKFNMQFRVDWHWNITAGDPYYALDCREDDFAWCNANDQGELICSIEFERNKREGIDDYRYLLTLDRLAQKKKDPRAMAVIEKYLSTFELGDLGQDTAAKPAPWYVFKRELAEEISRLRAP